MARRCGNCIHKNVCELYDIVQDPTHAVGCGNFLDTADVVPRSEVDWHREAELNAQRIMELEVELQAMRGAANSYKMHYENLAREIFEEIENVLKIVKIPCTNEDGYITPLRVNYWAIDPNDYAELKKKYTDETIT